jgi:hypothetical protein
MSWLYVLWALSLSRSQGATEQPTDWLTGDVCLLNADAKIQPDVAPCTTDISIETLLGCLDNRKDIFGSRSFDAAHIKSLQNFRTLVTCPFLERCNNMMQSSQRLSMSFVSVLLGCALGPARRTVRAFIPQSSPRLVRSATAFRLASTTTTTTKKVPGTANLGGIAWEDLGFEFRPTNSHIKVVYKENADGTGSWGAPELVKDPFVNVHIGATALHYGQACFEGLKAFCHADGNVHIFRPDENAARMQSSCRRTLMPEMPTDLFIQTVEQVVVDNLEYVPPYGSGGALYIRPLLFGSGPRIGLQPADEYTFICLVIPVGDYYAGGLSQPVKCVLIEDYDRAAPRGVGAVKVAGNNNLALSVRLGDRRKLWYRVIRDLTSYPCVGQRCLSLSQATMQQICFRTDAARS